MLTQHKKLMDEAQRLEPSVMVTERNWSALLEMQDRLFRQQMQLDADLKMLLTKAEAQESLIKMQTSAENFEKQAGSLNERYSSGCKALTETTKIALTTILNDTKNQLSDMEQDGTEEDHHLRVDLDCGSDLVRGAVQPWPCCGADDGRCADSATERLCRCTLTASAARSSGKRKPPSVTPRTITKIGIWNKKCERGDSMASIKQLSDRKYKITISNGYRTDGRKVCKAKTIQVPDSIPKRGVEQYVYHEAERLERLFKQGYSEDGEMTFETYARGWLERQTKYAPGTIAFYRRSLETVFPEIGAIKLNRLRPIALENLLAKLRKRTYRGKPIKEKTVQKYLTVVSAVLSDAKRNEIIEKNPARMIDLPDAERKAQEIPTMEEMQKFLSALCYEEPVFQLFYFLAINTGMRRGELCALRWSDVIVTGSYEGYIIVRHSRSTVSGEGVQEGKTKNGRTRTVSMNEEMFSLLRGFCYRKMRLRDEHGIPFPEYIFTKDDGTPIHPDTFSKHLKALFAEIGLPKTYHLHTLRHFFVSTLLHEGVDKNTVADLAGHGDTSFLERTYCHPQMQLKQEAAKRMSNSLFAAPNPELLVS